MTVAVEAKNMKDLPKLVEVLRQVAKEDPTLQVTINEETGEHLISGMGELHLEIITGRIKRDKGVEIITSEPIVVYRETVTQKAGPVEGKSPNRHNRFYIEREHPAVRGRRHAQAEVAAGERAAVDEHGAPDAALVEGHVAAHEVVDADGLLEALRQQLAGSCGGGVRRRSAGGRFRCR